MLGKWVTLEGGEGCGKSTQIQLLAEWLRGYGFSVHVTHEPGGVKSAEKLRGSLLYDPDFKGIAPATELMMFMAARTESLRLDVLPRLEQGDIVLSDRSLLSSVAYQGAAGGLDVSSILWAHKAFVLPKLDYQTLWPDLTIVLDISPETGLARKHEQAESSNEELTIFDEKSLEYHRAVNRGFVTCLSQYKEAIGGERVATIIDAEKCVKSVSLMIRQRIEELRFL